jgi:hypothetical protein
MIAGLLIVYTLRSNPRLGIFQFILVFNLVLNRNGFGRSAACSAAELILEDGQNFVTIHTGGLSGMRQTHSTRWINSK